MKEKEIKHFSESVFHDIIKTAIYARVKGSQYFNKLNMGITFEQYIALDAISSREDICQRDLSKLILKDRSNTSRILNVLEKEGFIGRNIETKNNRLVKKVYINDKGKAILDEHGKIIKKDLADIFVDITEEDFDNLKKLLKKIRDCISKETNMQI